MKRYNKSKCLTGISLVLAFVATPAMAAVYVWGISGDGDWDNASNWTPTGCIWAPCYPKGTNDDVNINDSAGNLPVITLEHDRTIDDLHLEDAHIIDQITFQSDDETLRTITCDTLTITDSLVHLKDTAQIKTN